MARAIGGRAQGVEILLETVAEHRALTSPEDTAVEIDLADAVSDPDGDALTLSLVSDPARGTAELDGTVGLDMKLRCRADTPG